MLKKKSSYYFQKETTKWLFLPRLKKYQRMYFSRLHACRELLWQAMYCTFKLFFQKWKWDEKITKFIFKLEFLLAKAILLFNALQTNDKNLYVVVCNRLNTQNVKEMGSFSFQQWWKLQIKWISSKKTFLENVNTQQSS